MLTDVNKFKKQEDVGEKKDEESDAVVVDCQESDAVVADCQESGAIFIDSEEKKNGEIS